MKFLTLDLASRSGWAIWAPGEPVRYGSYSLPKDAHFSLGEKLLRYANWLGQRLQDEQPDVVRYEAPWVGGKTAQQTAKLLFGLSSTTALICTKMHVRASEANNQAVRSHFAGTRVGNSRGDMKQRVMAQCLRCGWAPKNDDEADALALLSFAAHEARVPTDWGTVILGEAV